MSQLLALEYDSREVRVVVASSQGTEITIEHAFSAEFHAPGDEQQADGPAAIGEQIASALGARRIGRLDTLVALGRSNIELRHLAFPPVPDDELPDMVRLQAAREFTEFDESWLLDFIPLGSVDQGPRNVIAAAVHPSVIEQVQNTCEAAGVKPRRVVLRPCAAADLFARSSKHDPEKLTLLIDLLAEEVDLTVMSQRQVVYMRTTRLATNPLATPESAGLLTGELRRTMAAVQNQLGGRKIDTIVLCGNGPAPTTLAETLSGVLDTPVALFDPFEGQRLGRELKRGLPDFPGRFAPLLGMVLTELQQQTHAIDFLNPRRRPPPPSPYRRLIIPAVAVVVLLAVWFGWDYYQRAWLNAEIEKLAAEQKQLDTTIKEGKTAIAAVSELEKWEDTDVGWLDELARLSRSFPPAKEVKATQLTLGPASRGGEIKLEGLASSPVAIDQIEQKLRDAQHRVIGKGSSEDDSQKYYSWRFDTSVLVEP